jgi:hypothetical protein
LEIFKDEEYCRAMHCKKTKFLFQTDHCQNPDFETSPFGYFPPQYNFRRHFKIDAHCGELFRSLSTILYLFFIYIHPLLPNSSILYYPAFENRFNPIRYVMQYCTHASGGGGRVKLSLPV